MRPTEADEADCIEACIEALDEAILSLAQQPPRALAEALAIQLQGLLETLQTAGHCTAEEVRLRLDELARGALGPAAATDPSA